MVEFCKRHDVYDSVIARNGILMQMVVALEELSECSKEICKFIRDDGDIEHLAEEIADAMIMLEQIKKYYNINEKVCQYMSQKVRRVVERFEIENKS